MKGYPLQQIKTASLQERLERKLQTSLDNINVLSSDKDYSNLINNLANAIVTANELADLKADE